MSASLRIPEDMLRSWVGALGPRTDLRGAPAVAKEMEAHLRKVGSDGHVVIGRHQLFTWAETLQGVARRAPMGAPVQPIVDELRAVLAGRETPPASAAARPAYAPPAYAPPPYPPPAYGAPAAASAKAASPVTYLKGAAAAPGAAGAGARLVSESEVAGVVAGILREARRELLVVSPWVLGLETLAAELARAPSTLQLRIVSRRADREDEAYHRALRDLQRRGADLVMSPFLHTRMVIADGEVLLLGAAGLPKPGVDVAREAAILTSDPQVVLAAREHFSRIHDEAKRGPPRA